MSGVQFSLKITTQSCSNPAMACPSLSFTSQSCPTEDRSPIPVMAIAAHSLPVGCFPLTLQWIHIPWSNWNAGWNLPSGPFLKHLGWVRTLLGPGSSGGYTLYSWRQEWSVILFLFFFPNSTQFMSRSAQVLPVIGRPCPQHLVTSSVSIITLFWATMFPAKSSHMFLKINGEKQDI